MMKKSRTALRTVALIVATATAAVLASALIAHATEAPDVPTVTVTHAAAVTPAAAPKACHTAYTVDAHDVPEHTVKATPKHSAYVVYAHTVPAHVVKANC